MADDGWVDCMALDDLWEGDLVAVDLAGTPVLLVNLDGRILAYDNRCPHQASPLNEGELDGNVLVCSRHLWCFDVSTGMGVNPESARLTGFEAKVDDGRILVRPVHVTT